MQGNADVTTKTVLLAFLQGIARYNAKQKAQQNAVSAWNHWQMQATIKPEYVDFMKHFATEVIAKRSFLTLTAAQKLAFKETRVDKKTNRPGNPMAADHSLPHFDI